MAIDIYFFSYCENWVLFLIINIIIFRFFFFLMDVALFMPFDEET